MRLPWLDARPNREGRRKANQAARLQHRQQLRPFTCWCAAMTDGTCEMGPATVAVRHAASTSFVMAVVEREYEV